MKALILAGGDNARLAPITQTRPKALLPFLNRSLLATQVLHLARQGFTRIGLALAPQDADLIHSELGRGDRFGVTLTYHTDEAPRGPAGCLALFEDFIGNDPFLVINGNVYLGSVDLGRLIKFHDTHAAAATLGMYEGPSAPTHVENVITSPGGQIQSFHILHPSRDRRRPRRFAGIYFFDSRVLAFVRRDGYMDLKEQLIPAIHQAGYGIFEHRLEGFHAYVGNPDDYYHAHMTALQRGVFDETDYTREGERIWVGAETSIASSVYLLGPILIGRGCIIDEHAQIVGPAVIGDGCTVGRGALVRESVVWEETSLAERARLEYCVAGSRLRIASGHAHRDAVLMGNGARVRGQSRTDVPRTPAASAGRVSAAIGWFEIAKRMMDVVGAATGLVVAAPLLALIALVVKWDSPGPALFRQRRCGKDGREFQMIKFRTMVLNAEGLQGQLAARNDVDGPVFKMFHDPRVTRVGRVLRRTSLDELPQLFNVLTGDMSLVGPRPLAVDEMRFSPTWRDFRLMVKPGLTGLWQLNGRSQTGFHEWIRSDIAYVKHRSLFLDVKILWKTAWAVFRGV